MPQLPPLHNAGPLLLLAIVLVAGVSFGTLAKRLHVPSVTGQILAGILLGPAGFRVIAMPSIDALRPLTHFALALMAVTIGAHLNVSRLRNAGKRLFLLILFESLITPLLVAAAVCAVPEIKWSTALLFGTLAISTAPATTLALVRETRAQGVFVKTLIAAVALNNMSCVLLFELARSASRVQLGGARYTALQLLAGPGVQLVEAMALGGVAALGMELFARFGLRRDKLATAAVVTLLLVSGLANALDVSPLLAALFLGMIQANVTRQREKLVDALFSDFWPAVLIVFFTLAGMELSFDHVREVGVIAALFFGARALGKVLAARWAMGVAGATDKLRKYLGMALLPQAGVAIGLVVLLEDDPAFRTGDGAHVLPIFVGVVLTVVTASEIVGPILTRIALSRSGEVGRDRLRLIDFIREENIVTELKARTKEEAIEKLTDLLVSSHQLEGETRAPLLKSILDREAEISTCLGSGLAVPHGFLPRGSKMVGVMGLSRKGLPFETPDGQPIHCMVLLATPDNERTRHLQVLASLARTIGMDGAIQAQLYSAKSAAHAYEILHDEDAESFNQFLDEADEPVASAG